MKLYDIEFKDNEGDILQITCESLKEAREEIKKIKSEGGQVKETWIYNEDGDFKGRF